MTIYLDILFLFNFLTDFLLLSLNRRTMGAVSSTKHMMFGSLVGAAGACLIFFYVDGIASVFGALFLSYVMVLIAFPGNPFKIQMKLSIAFLCESIFLAAAATMIIRLFDSDLFSVSGGVIYLHTSSYVLLLSITGAYLLICLYDAFFRKKNIQEKYIWIDLQIGEITQRVLCLVDTGNLMRDPITGEPIVLLCERALEKFFQSSYDTAQMIFKIQGREYPARIFPAVGIGKTKVLPLIGKCSVVFTNSKENSGRCACLVGVMHDRINGRDDIGLINPNSFIL